MAVLLLRLLLLLLLAAASGVRAGPRGRVGGEQDYDLDGGLGGLLPPDEEDEAAATAGPAPPVCPSRCLCAFDHSPKRVDCSSRKLTAFPALEVPEDVEYLDLSDNQIRTVPRDLPAWEHLEVLSLAGNELTDFPPNALSGMAALEMLDLSRNNIASLRHLRPDRFIAHNPLLQVLNLSGNGLQSLGHGSFQSLTSDSLQVLDVSHCAVSSLDGQNALEALPALRVLRVNGNPLQLLPALAAPALRELDASDCRLRTVHAEVLGALPGLTHLAVSRNPDLAHFQPPGLATPAPEDPDQLIAHLAHLTNGTPPWSSALQVLEAEDCSVHDAAFLATLPNLTEVRMRGNRLDTLEPLALLDNGALLHLDLADNKLENLPAEAFKGTERLRELDLSGNRLSAIHADTFAAHAALHVLNVSRNPMASLQLTAPALRVLDAAHAELQLLADGLLDGTPQLRHLNLSHNPLPALPGRLASPGSDSALHTLDVSFCRLADLSATALDGLPLLQTLDLRGNRLTDALSKDAFAENDVLHHIDLDDNPWRCDCRAKDYRDFVDFLLAQPAKEDIHSLRCHSPEAVAGQTWFDACLGPRGSSLGSIDTWMFVVILSLCVAVVGAGVFTVRRMTRGKARRRRQQQQQEEEERRACEQEAARRRLHRRMQQQQQEQLRRQSVRASVVAGEDPDPHPPSYEEAVLMDRMTQDDPVENGNEDSSDSEDEDAPFTAELHKKVSRLNSSGGVVVDDVIVEEEEGAGSGTESSSTPGVATTAGGADGSAAGHSNGSAPRLSTKL